MDKVYQTKTRCQAVFLSVLAVYHDLTDCDGGWGMCEAQRAANSNKGQTLIWNESPLIILTAPVE